MWVWELGQCLEGKDNSGVEAKLHGLFIAVPWDSRRSRKMPNTNFYSAKVESPQAIKIKVPAYDYSLLYGMKNFLLGPSREAIGGMNSGAVGFDKDPQKELHKWKEMVLQFPAGTVLSATALDEKAEGGTLLDLQVFAIKVDGVTSTYAGWAVANLAKESRKLGDLVGGPAKPKSKEAEAADRLAALGIH